MSIQVYRFTIVDEHHALLFIKVYQQRYLACIAFDKHSYYLSDILHLEKEHCVNCHTDVEENTPCYHFSFHEKDVQKLEKTVEYYMKIHVLNKGLFSSYPLKNKKSTQAKKNQDNIIQLNLIAINREEIIEAYGNTFTYYSTKQNGKRMYITLEQKKKKTKPKGTTLLNKHWVEKFIANNLPLPDVLQELEQEITQRYDVSLTKWNKMMQLIEGIKQCILLYTGIYEQYKGPSFQDLIVYLHEVLYREIPLRDFHSTDFLKKHEQMSSILQLYIINEIAYNDCINQLVKNPHDYSPQRKERVIYTIKALLKTKEVLQQLTTLRVDEAIRWHEQLCVMLILYLKIELGVLFKPKPKQKELEEFLFRLFSKYEKGELKETDLYAEINECIPFIEEHHDEKINRYLQQINKNKPHYVFYLMEIDFQGDFVESLSQHEAYKGFEKIEVTACDLLKEEQTLLLSWMVQEAAYHLCLLLKEFEIEPNTLRIWKVKNKPYPEMDEYIIYNGEGLYRLHFRKEP